MIPLDPALPAQLPRRALSPLADAGAGAIGGITGGLMGFPGAAVTIWAVSQQGWSKDRQRALFQPFILAMQVATLASLHAMAPHGSALSRFEPRTLAYVPLGLAGTQLGLRLYGRLSERQFRIVVNALLIVSGLALVL